jgi:hypothetical protein
MKDGVSTPAGIGEHTDSIVKMNFLKYNFMIISLQYAVNSKIKGYIRHTPNVSIMVNIKVMLSKHMV